ncbi:hypothetical protein HY024_02170 [Candidatus Curtissbacteria bacterium]|nr:hypothetical protein [Candidatus Curtissbacteria bacterium]
MAEDFNLPQASDGEIHQAQNRLVPLRFLPNQPWYFLITVKEEIDRIFQPSSAKRAQFDLILAGKRLKEAYALVQKGDLQGSSNALLKYSERLVKLDENLNRARSQNQEVNPLVLAMAEQFKSHEVLIFAINDSRKKQASDSDLENAFKKALGAFIASVNNLNQIKPGVRDRFKSATESAKPNESTDTAVPQEEAPKRTYSPRKIIY